MLNSILVGDCRETLRTLPDDSVHCVVTSPPYFGLRNYGGQALQIGLEATPDEFVAAMVEVFREVRRVLRRDGTFWLNLGDSYVRNPSKGGSGPGGKNEERWGYGAAQNAKVGSSDGVVGRAARPGSRARADGLKDKDLIGIPWKVAFALQADGWYLRQDIIWSKPNPMPESVKDRCTKSHEYVFMFSKSPRYHFDHEAIMEPMAASSLPRLRQNIAGQTGTTRANGGAKSNGNFKAAGNVETGLRNKRSVWTVTTKPFKEAHFATYPPDLIEPCILAGCPVGGTVLDPFLGSGTTAMVARDNGRNWIGCELNPDYLPIIRRRLGLPEIEDDFDALLGHNGGPALDDFESLLA
jgi:DNA modification methylase